MPEQFPGVEDLIELWPDAVDEDDCTSFTHPYGEPGDVMLQNVTRPTLTPYLPDPAAATGTALVICPGGAHHLLASVHEGSKVAQWLAVRGIAAFVLHYRLLPTPVNSAERDRAFGAIMSDQRVLNEHARRHRPIAVADGARALALVRDNAEQWGIARDRVGIVGFSAGAYVATATTLDTPPQGRPNFLGAIYGGIREGDDPTVPRGRPSPVPGVGFQ